MCRINGFGNHFMRNSGGKSDSNRNYPAAPPSPAARGCSPYWRRKPSMALLSSSWSDRQSKSRKVFGHFKNVR